MNLKITPEHLSRGATVYIRQSTMGQVVEHTESQRRQYALAESARELGFVSVTIIDDDLGRSGSGLVARPGFQKLVAAVCSGPLGAVFCIEASRLARNGRDWHHLIDLCALAGTLVIDPDGVYDPRLINDRLLLGLKGTMSEYELSLLRQRGLAARDSKARRGELRFALPPGYCWNELGCIEMDPDERIVETIRLVFRKFRELGSARQVFLWARQSELKLPVWRQSRVGGRIEWRAPAYHTVIQLLQHPVYVGAYVFGRKAQHTHVVDGRARKTEGHRKPMSNWNVLLRDHHPGYISWEEFEENQQMIAENAYMQRRMSRKGARGGPGAVDRPSALWAMWPNDARVLRHALGPRPPLPMPRRRWSCGRRTVHRHRWRTRRSGCCRSASRSSIRNCDRSCPAGSRAGGAGR